MPPCLLASPSPSLPLYTPPMPDGLLFALTLAALLGAALVAGVFYAFSTFVMGALDRRPAAEAIAAMQSA